MRVMVRMMLSVLVASFYFGISQNASASSDSGTLTAALNTSSCPSGRIPIVEHIGFLTGTFGSYNPTGLTGGESVFGLYDIHWLCLNGQLDSFLSVSGFSSDPGSGWLTSVTCNGVERMGSAATSYGYSGGNAGWGFGGNFGFTSGSNYSCTIVHN